MGKTGDNKRTRQKREPEKRRNPFRKIRSSLSAKVFLWVMAALMVCGLLIYGIVMLVIPRRYTTLSNNRVNAKIEQLTRELQHTDFTAAEEKISEFCRKNHAAAVLTMGEESLNFGDMEDTVGQESSYTVSVVLSFPGTGGNAFLTVVCAAAAAGELNRTFLQILPFVLTVVFLIAALSAWLCSKVIVRPVQKIAEVSKRMARLDMTWRCETGREDELGVLAKSLNTLSDRLAKALAELEGSNEKLRQEVETVNALQRQRCDFFAAASHELKTPITILKGQIESMILGIGKYRDVKDVLPQTLCEVERMEGLVQELLGIVKLEMRKAGEETGTVAVHEEVEEALFVLLPLAKEKKIAVFCEKEEVFITGNAALFQKALRNIISNAIRHSPEKSEVTVRLTAECLTVKNTGVLLPKEEIGELFTPFYRVEKSRNKSTGGSGLGLYLVKRILELHGLDFRLENGQGCVIFRVGFVDRLY